MIVLLHNSRCSKSREALKLINNSGKKFILREYLKNPLDLEELQDLQSKLKLKAIDLTRTLEAEFKEAWLNKDSEDNTILKAMVRFPKLLQRSIVFDESKAFICRPPIEVLKIFKK